MDTCLPRVALMAGKTPRAKPDVAPVELRGTPVSLERPKGKRAGHAKRVIHERRPAPPIPRGEPVPDETPSAPATIEPAPEETPRKR